MKLSPIIMECAAVIEREKGRKPSERALRLMESSYQLGLTLYGTGHRHASEGCRPMQESDVAKLVDVLPVAVRETVAKLAYEDYMEGYNAVLEVRG